MTPRLSIVIPTYRRPELLARCLQAIVNQSADPDLYEVVVADDAASESTRAQVEGIALFVRPAVRYVPVADNHGPAAARNAGWRAARGQVIAFTDDDTIPEPEWVAAGLGAFERDPELAAATGRTEVPLPPRPTDYERNESGLATAEFITANCFVRRKVLEELGGFDERFRAAWREDSDLHFALLESGCKVIEVLEAVVLHPVRAAPWAVSIRLQKKSQYDALLYKKHPGLYQRKIGIQRPWDYYAIVLSLSVSAVGIATGSALTTFVCAGLWLGLTLRFAQRRLRGNSRQAGHIAEMLVTSAIIPTLSLFWRLYGALKFRVLFL